MSGPIADDFVFIPGYVVTRLLSQSPHSWIYEGIDRADKETVVAIEVARTNDEATRVWYTRVENTLGHLEHPHIPALGRSGLVDGYPYLVFSRLPTVDLARRLQEPSGISQETILTILDGIAAALEYAHGLEIVHGDLHAGRVGFCQDGHLLVTGFGEALRHDLPGNSDHQAPEVLLNGHSAQSPRSDLYSLSRLAYRLLGGEYPLGPASQGSAPHSGGEPSTTPHPAMQFRDLRRDLSASVAIAVGKCLSTDPQLRLGSVDEFIRELRRACDR